MNAIQHIVAQHLHVNLLPAAAPAPDASTKNARFFLKYGSQIAELREQGYSNGVIAKILGIAPGSVRLFPAQCQGGEPWNYPHSLWINLGITRGEFTRP